MKELKKLRTLTGLVLCFLLFGHMMLTQARAIASGLDDNNLFLFPVNDKQQIKDEFDMGNILLFDDSKSESDDDGVIDDSVPTEEDDDGEIDDNSGVNTPEAASGIGRVMGANIVLRSQPSADSEVVAELSEGATLTITGRDGSWLQVTFGILNGYVHSSYIFEVTDEGLNGTILRDGVNMRESGDLNSKILQQLSAGVGVRVTDYVNSWYKISYKEKMGYVRSDCITVSGAFTGESSTRLLKSGMSGEVVKKAQTELKRRGFFIGDVTGDYGPKTSQAVKAFQSAAKITADGVLGEQSLALLYGNNAIKVSIATASQVKGRILMTEWSKVNTIIPRGKTFKVIDVRTGISWSEIRHGGYLHIDSEPLTANDTAKLKRVYGGSWTWNRRPVWVIYGNNVYAASMNGMPHGSAESIGSSNNFKGVHCIHFYKSKTHCGQKMDARHQACVLESYKAGK